VYEFNLFKNSSAFRFIMAQPFRAKILPSAETLIGSALRKAAKKAGMKKTIREKEKARVLTFYSEIGRKLASTQDSLPRIDKMHDFQKELAELIIGLADLRKVLAHFRKSRKIIAKLKKQTIYKLENTTANNEIRQISREFLGRAISVVKKLDRSILLYNEYVKKLREIPDVRYDTPTLIIAGYPNVGKTTLLKTLTGSAPKIAPYPFTTTKLNLGYMKKNAMELQVIDTPGLLDRKLSGRSNIERKSVLALKLLANAIVFVIDPTPTSGYPIEEQERLLKEIKKQFAVPILVVISKADIASEEEIKKASEVAKRLGLECILNSSKALEERVWDFTAKSASYLRK